MRLEFGPLLELTLPGATERVTFTPTVVTVVNHGEVRWRELTAEERRFVVRVLRGRESATWLNKSESLLRLPVGARRLVWLRRRDER